MSPPSHLAAPGAAGAADGEEGAEGSSDGPGALQLDGEHQEDEDQALQGQGHQESAHARLRHGEVVLLVGDVWEGSAKG